MTIYLSTIYKSHNSQVELHSSGSDIVIVKKLGHAIKQHNELNILRQVDHPNIVKVLGIGTNNTIVFKYYPNGDLFDMIYKHRRRMPSKRKIVHQLLKVVTYLHDREIAHLDIKPENVVFDNDNRLILIDFDMACRACDYNKDHRVGTIEYFPPELNNVEQKHLRDPFKQDVWCIGILIYEMIFKSTRISWEKITLYSDSTLKQIIQSALEIDVTKRCTCRQLLHMLAVGD